MYNKVEIQISLFSNSIAVVHSIMSTTFPSLFSVALILCISAAVYLVTCRAQYRPSERLNQLQQGCSYSGNC